MECKWVKQHISIDTYGYLRPCCNYQSTGDEHSINKISEYKNGSWVNNLESQLLEDVWPKGCADCKIDEEHGITSLRQEGFEKYKNFRQDAEVKFGNLCNLACSMCSPTNSSLIDKEIRELKLTEDHFFIKDRKLYNSTNNWYDDEKQLAQVAEYLSDRSQIRFTGGEPTVNHYLIKFLDVLIKNNSKAEIRLTTNGNNWPKKLHEKLLNFNVKVDLSIDGYKEVNEYIRWPSSWKKIEKNLFKIKEISRKISCYTTVSCYNVHKLPDLCNWVKENNFDSHILNVVTTPVFMNPCNSNNFSKDIFLKLAEEYKPANRIKNMVLKSGNETNLKNTYEYLKILDRKRNTDVDILGVEWRKYE